MKQSRIAALATVMVLSPWLSFGQIQTEIVSGQEVAAHEVLLQLWPWATTLGFSRQSSQLVDAESMHPIGRTGRIRLKSRSKDVPTLLAALSLNSLVASVEPNYIIHASDTIPNDPDFPQLWGMQNTGQNVQGQTGVPFADISAVKAWDIGRGSSGIVVGVVDSGVDYTHPDLAANVWSASTSYQIVSEGVTYTCPPGSHGFNFVALTCNPLDDYFHGTHVSGIIGAQGNNLQGVAGVNWTTSILALKFLDSTGTGTVADAMNAIEAAVQLKSQGVNIRVLNNSWGVAGNGGSLEEAVNDANNSDMLFVAAAGNSGSSNDGELPEYPASYNVANVIAVAATDNQDDLASFSNYGLSSVHLGAPGVNILSTVPGASYEYLSGTSMAAPHVSGTAALVLSKCSLDTNGVKAAILNSVDPIPSLAGRTITGGRVNVYKALSYCGASQTPEFSMMAAPTVLSVAPGGSAVTQITVTDLGGFSGTVTLSASGVPAGVTASFSQTSLTGSGSSMLTLTTSTATPLGNYPITVLGSTSSLVFPVAVTLTVSAPDFALSASPSAVTVTDGSSANSTITIAALNGFSGVVNLTASGLPSGVTATFSSNSVNGSGSPALTLAAAANATPGSYPITVQGASGTLIHTTPITLTVMGAPDFTLSASPASVTGNMGSSVTSKITVTALNAFNGVVSFAASGMPAGVTAAFSPASVTGSGTSTLTLTVSASAVGGTYPISVQASSANLLHSTTVTLTVTTADFTLSISPAAVVVASGGGSATSTVTISALNGFTGSVTLTATGLPSGVSVSFSPPSVNGAGSSVLTLTTSAGAPTGSFNVNLQGASGALSHTTPLAVTSQPAILLPANLSVFPGSSVPYPISLGSPATSNVYVALANSDTTKVSLSVSTVLFQAGSTTPSVTPKVTGVSFGSATITASAWTYATVSQTVSVTDALSFSPTSVSVGQGASQFLTLLLSAPLSTSLTVNLSSDNPAVASVPATITIPANTTSASIRITGVAAGSTTIHANALPSIPDTTATVKVGAPLTIVTTVLANGSVNATYSQTLSANGGTAPLTWALTSGTLPTGLTLNPATGQITGTPTATVTNTPLTFKVTDASFPAQTATTNLILTISSGGPSAASIAATKGTPQSAPVNTAFSILLVAMVKDAMGNPLSGAVVTFLAPSGGATGTFATGISATAATDVTGAASAVFTANSVAGAYSVLASVSGVAAPATFALTNLAGPAARVSVTSGSGQITAVNTPFAAPLGVTVSDAVGNPVSGVKVTFTAPASSASGSFAGGANTITTNASGVASTMFTANGTPGTYSVTATVAGVAAAASFSLTNIGPAASVTVVSGGNQSAPINSTFTNPLVVKVLDAAGDPVAGVTVVFLAPSTGASGAFSGSNMVNTNSAGIATSPAFTANSIAGSYTVTASVTGAASSASFLLTNLSGIILPPVTTLTPGVSTPFPITLGVPAPANGVFIMLASSDTTKVTISATNIFVPGGSTIPTLIPKVTGLNLGSVTITASGWNYQPVTQQLQVSEATAFFPGSASISAGSIQYVSLTLSAPAPVSLTVNLTSDTPSVATAPATVTFPANATSVTVRLTGVAPGSATITAGAPPNVTAASIAVTVK